MNLIFCEECGGRNVIEDQALREIAENPLACQVCGFPIAPEHIINHTGAGGKVIDTSAYKLLIIDDDQTHLQLMQITLSREYNVSVAASGTDGLQKAESLRPDLVLLDVNMPGIDGHEVCARLKNNPETRPIPVIFITAKNEGDDEYKGFTLGAVDYIVKPINLKILNAKIAVHLKFKALRDEHRQEIDEQKKTIKLLKRDVLERDEHLRHLETQPGGQGDGDRVRSLEQTIRNLKDLLDTVGEVITMQDAERRIVWANKAALAIFDVELAEMQGMTCYKFYFDMDEPCSTCILNQDGKERGGREEIYNPLLNMTFLRNSVLLRDADGKASGVAHVSRLKEVAERDGRADQQAGGIEVDDFLDKSYIEFNDVISIILLSSDAVRNLHRDDERLAKLNDYISDASDRLRAMFNTVRRRGRET